MLSDGDGMWCVGESGVRRRYVSVDICIPKGSPCWLKKPLCIRCDIGSWQVASLCGCFSLQITALQVAREVKKEVIS